MTSAKKAKMSPILNRIKRKIQNFENSLHVQIVFNLLNFTIYFREQKLSQRLQIFGINLREWGLNLFLKTNSGELDQNSLSKFLPAKFDFFLCQLRKIFPADLKVKSRIVLFLCVVIPQLKDFVLSK